MNLDTKTSVLDQSKTHFDLLSSDEESEDLLDENYQTQNTEINHHNAMITVQAETVMQKRMNTEMIVADDEFIVS